MTDRPGPRDPLQGLDPYPRERIEGLHAERADLLEEIVSTPGPGKQPTSRTRLLIAGGIAAALVIVGGGVWFATGGDDSATDDAPVAAASTTPEATEPDQATDPAGEPTEPDRAEDVRRGGVRVGEVEELDGVRPGDLLDPETCRDLRARWRVSPDGSLVLRGDRQIRLLPHRGRGPIRLRTLREGLTHLSELERLPRSARAYYLGGRRGEWVAIDGGCVVVDRGRGPWVDVYLRDRR